ncbi:MAG: hypothetical protein IT225_06105 [Flavobacteriales bacterium]|nr:hypothetical protein [Flavobacteriales bacterium]
MQHRFLALAALLTTFTLHAQYGTFDAGAVKAAKSTRTVVVLDAGDSPYNRTMIESAKANWKFTTELEFLTVADLATQPIAPDRTYLLKTRKTDPVKFEATFLTLVKGWKPKKGETLAQTDNEFTSIPAEHEVAFIQIDPKGINEPGMARLLDVYLKHLQNYLTLVEGGKITDKTTADRTYSSRNRLVRDTEFWLAKEHMDKSLPDAAKVKEFYTAPCQVMALSQIASLLEKGSKEITISDVVLTGENKNKHCFKRVFNVGTGELMYMRDDAAIFGKKEGFIDEDLKNLERAR